MSRPFEWLLAACLAGLVAALLFVLVRGGEYLVEPKYALLMVGTPMALIIGLFGLRVWAPSLIPGATLSLVALGVALLSAEAVFLSGDTSVWGNQDLVADRAEFLTALGPAANPQPNFFSKDLVRRSGGEEYRSVLSTDRGELLPLTGVADATVAMCRDSDAHWQTFRSDKYGFSNPNELWDGRVPALLAVGDSHVQGWCVSLAQSFMGRIRASVANTINLGVAGNGPLADLALLREYGRQARPAKVLWMFTLANDVSDLDRESRTPILRNYVEPSHGQGLMGRQPEIDRSLRDFAAASTAQGKASIDWAEVTRRLLTLYDVRLRFQVDRGSVEEPNYTLFRRVMTEARNEVAAWGGELVFVFLPSQLALRGEAPGQAEVGAIVRELRIPIIDVTEAFAAQPDPPALFQAREGTHYSEPGHALVASTILAALAR